MKNLIELLFGQGQSKQMNSEFSAYLQGKGVDITDDNAEKMLARQIVQVSFQMGGPPKADEAFKWITEEKGLSI